MRVAVYEKPILSTPMEDRKPGVLRCRRDGEGWTIHYGEYPARTSHSVHHADLDKAIKIATARLLAK